MDQIKSSTEHTVSLRVDIQKEAMKTWTQAIGKSLEHLILAGIPMDDLSTRIVTDRDGTAVYILVKGNAVIKHTFKLVFK